MHGFAITPRDDQNRSTIYLNIHSLDRFVIIPCNVSKSFRGMIIDLITWTENITSHVMITIVPWNDSIGSTGYGLFRYMTPNIVSFHVIIQIITCYFKRIQQG